MIAGDTTDPLFDDWDTYLADPAGYGYALWATVAGRGQSLVDDFPIAAAMVKAKLNRIHGAYGLRFRSHFQRDNAADTDAQEIETRRQIELAIAAGSIHIDAGGMLSRSEFDWQMSWNACVLGDAFAVRVWQDIPGIPTSTRWRIINPARVKAPPGKEGDPLYAGGIQVDPIWHRPVALWVVNDKRDAKGNPAPNSAPEPIPWFAEDGTRNVVHKVGIRVPGSRRGLSEFAPIMLPARMLHQIDVAYTALKRVQASHPLFIKVADVKAAREMYRGTAIANLLVAKDHEVQLNQFKFEGADYREFVDVEMRSMGAAWQLPWELVLGDHSAKSGASSRSLWQQHYQMADREQAQHADQVERPVDESLVREAEARGRLTLTDDWGRNMAGIYQGPPKVMPDPNKEIQWAIGARQLGMSRSTILARLGEDLRDEVMQDRQDAELYAAQGVQPPSDAVAAQPVAAATTTDPTQQGAQPAADPAQQGAQP